MILYWGLLSMYSIFHIIICFLGKEKIRKITKVFIVPFLLVGLLLYKYDNPFIYLGLFLGYIGDILLCFTKKKECFAFGTFAFMSGHLSYIIATQMRFLNQGIKIHLVTYLLVSIFGVLFVFLASRVIVKKIGKIAYLGSFYFYVVLIALLCSAYCGFYLLSLGFLLFLVSDAMICIGKFVREIRNRHAYVMITYILAQVSICLSFLYNL